MFSNIPRLGFCCHIVDIHGEQIKGTKIKGTTLTSFRKLSVEDQHSKLVEIATVSGNAVKEKLRYVSLLVPTLRMMRLPSDIMCFYDSPEFKHLWFDSGAYSILSKLLGEAGDYARKHDIKLSSHPGQFCVANSDKESVRKNAVLNLDANAEVARMMGYCKSPGDFKINIHASGKIDQPDSELNGRDFTLTLENDERTGTIERVLDIAEAHGCPVVFDMHHHWCHNGEWLEPDSEILQRVARTWPAGVRPTVHVSQSLEEYLVESGSGFDSLPDFDKLREKYARGKLFAHSQMIESKGLIQLIGRYMKAGFDVQVEAKMKNIASTKILQHLTY